MSKPRFIHIVRHAQSFGNVDRAIHATIPDWQIPLTELGREQAAAAGRDLSSQIEGSRYGVYLSPYKRTRDTWDEMLVTAFYAGSEMNLAFVKEDPRLREQEWGNLRAYENRSWRDIEAERDAYGPFFFRFASGESGGDVYDRCTGFLDTLYRDFEKRDFPETVVIVTHGFTMRVLLMRWLHWTVEEFHTLGNPPNCYRATLELDHTAHYRLSTPFPPRREVYP